MHTCDYTFSQVVWKTVGCQQQERVGWGGGSEGAMLKLTPEARVGCILIRTLSSAALAMEKRSLSLWSKLCERKR